MLSNCRLQSLVQRLASWRNLPKSPSLLLKLALTNSNLGFVTSIRILSAGERAMTALLAYTACEDFLVTRLRGRVPGKDTEPRTTKHPVLVLNLTLLSRAGPSLL